MKSGYYRIQFMINGKTYEKSSKTKNKRHAEQMEAKWRTDIHNRLFVHGKQEIKVNVLIDNYLALPLAESTIKNATTFFSGFREHVECGVNASDFDQESVAKYVQMRIKSGIKESTVRTQLLYFSGAWNDGNKKIYNIPDLELPKLKKPDIITEYPNQDEEDQLIAYILGRKPRGAGGGENRYEVHDVFALLLDTGCRHNEIGRLQWPKIDLENRTIELYRKKTGTTSYIKMTDRVHAVLTRRAENKKHSKWAFPNGDCTNHRRDSTTHLNKIIKDAGLPYTEHQCRHAFASKLLKLGMTLAEVQILLGHSSIQSTMRYVHLEKNATSGKAVDILNAEQRKRRGRTLKVVSTSAPIIPLESKKSGPVLTLITNRDKE